MPDSASEHPSTPLPRRQAMYACTHEPGSGFFDVVCTPCNATAHSYDLPHPQHKSTGAPLPGLRPEEDH
jgi:hypothetical protein